MLVGDNSTGSSFSQAGFLQGELAVAAAVPAEWECYYIQVTDVTPGGSSFTFRKISLQNRKSYETSVIS